MKVKLTHELRAVPEGEVYPVTYGAGAIVEGRVAQAALDQKRGEEFKAIDRARDPTLSVQTTAQDSAPENKALVLPAMQQPAPPAAPQAPAPAAGNDDPPAHKAKTQPPKATKPATG